MRSTKCHSPPHRRGHRHPVQQPCRLMEKEEEERRERREKRREGGKGGKGEKGEGKQDHERNVLSR